MNIKEIKILVELVNKSDLTELKWEHDGEKITLRKEKEIIASVASAPVAVAPAYAAAAPLAAAALVPAASETAAPASNYKEITSPMVGTFYAKASPDVDQFVSVGGKVAQGQTVCIVEAMKLMNEIESEVEGEIVEICVKDGTPVEFGTVLFKVK
jgi:acetyl-CoA carboxylase biotin carboxyl carrier protein